MDQRDSKIVSTITTKSEGRADWSQTVIDNFGEMQNSLQLISGYRGPRQSGHPIHDVTHVVRAFSPSTQEVELKNFWPQAPVINKVTARVFTACQVGVGTVPSPSSSQIDAIMAQLRGEIPTDVLLPNFLLELPEALTLHKQLAKAFRPSVKNWSNAGLAYSFGLAPLIKDLNSLINVTSRVKKRIDHLSRVSDSAPQRYKFNVGLEQPHDITVTDAGSSGPIRLGCLEGVQAEATATINMSIFARIIRTRRVDSNVDYISACADALGFSKPGSVIWEALPFSFVADWFHPCGRALNALNTSAFSGCLYATSVGHQSTITISGDVTCTGIKAGLPYWFSGPNIVSGSTRIGSAYAKFYNRSAGLPASQDVNHYGLRQSILSAMLCLQRA